MGHLYCECCGLTFECPSDAEYHAHICTGEHWEEGNNDEPWEGEE